MPRILMSRLGINWKLDPVGAYADEARHYNGDYILDMCGILPLFLDAKDERDIKTQMTERYGFGSTWMDVTIDGEGNFIYSDDPPLKPVAEAELRGEKVRIYPYGLVAVVDENGEAKYTRMD